MATSTPTKDANKQDVASPSAKRALDFDFWSERRQKVAKIVDDDLKDCHIKDLILTKRCGGKITLRCLAVSNLEKVLKLACDDGMDKITVTAFGRNAVEFRTSLKKYDYFQVTHFEVKQEHETYQTGGFQNLEIILNDCAKLEVLSNHVAAPIPYVWTSISELKKLPDGSVVDVLAVVAMNWAVTKTSTGKQKLDVSLTDMTMETIRLTLWEDTADQLVGIERNVVAISRAWVSSFQGIKMLNSKWHSHIEVNPQNAEAAELLEWFQKELTSK